MYLMNRKDSYTESELKAFEIIIVDNNWITSTFKLVNKFLIKIGRNH